MSVISIESKVLFHSLRIVANSLVKKFRVGGGGEGVGGGGGEGNWRLFRKKNPQ